MESELESPDIECMSQARPATSKQSQPPVDREGARGEIAKEEQLE